LNSIDINTTGGAKCRNLPRFNLTQVAIYLRVYKLQQSSSPCTSTDPSTRSAMCLPILPRQLNSLEVCFWIPPSKTKLGNAWLRLSRDGSHAVVLPAELLSFSIEMSSHHNEKREFSPWLEHCQDDLSPHLYVLHFPQVCCIDSVAFPSAISCWPYVL